MKFIFFAAILLLGFACRQPIKIQPSFYYWKTSLYLNNNDLVLLKKFETNDLYLRFFDVDYSEAYGQAVPVAEVNIGRLDGRPVVPVIYITNRTFKYLDLPQIDIMAQKIAIKVDTMSSALYQLFRQWRPEKANLSKSEWRKLYFSEIQFDCDWTPSTQGKYFQFIQKFRQYYFSNASVSCTIRLHQFRDYATTGVPPVDKGMLMCYNVAQPNDTTTTNAIFDEAIVNQYIKKGAHYPLKLDLALPLFSWGSWFRAGKFKGLLQGWDDMSFTDSACFKQTGNRLFQLKKDTVMDDLYFREGDLVRLDKPSEEEVQDVVPLLQSIVKDSCKVVFFDWNSGRITQDSLFVQNVIHRFRQ